MVRPVPLVYDDSTQTAFVSVISQCLCLLHGKGQILSTNMGLRSGTMSNKAESGEFVGAQTWTLRRTGAAKHSFSPRYGIRIVCGPGWYLKNIPKFKKMKVKIG